MTNQEKFCWYLDDLCSPRHFLKWNYKFSISSILARKVWFSHDAPIFPNLYCIFVGPPSIGKSLPAEMTKREVEKMKELVVIPGTEKTEWRNLVNLSPDSLTVERLIESLANIVDSIKVSDNPKKFYVHSSMTFYITEELTNLFKTKQEDLVDFLVAGWNGGGFKRETKSGDRFNIQNMCINFLGCTTADRLAKCVNSDLISQGFTSRTLFIYGEKPYHRVVEINASAEQRKALEEVKEHWKKVGRVLGQVNLSLDARAWLDDWIKFRMDKYSNRDKKLEDYYGRKYHHLVKLAMVNHFSEKTTMTLDVEDFEGGLKDLELNEVDMHKALKSMGRNPVHTLAEDIKRGIEQAGTAGLSYRKILATYFDGGNKEEINQALEHKTLVGDFKTYNNGKENVYQINHNNNLDAEPATEEKGEA